MLLDTWVCVELEELGWRCRRCPRLAMEVLMASICWPRINISSWKLSNCSSSLLSTCSNLCRMPCCMRQCCPRVMYSSSPSKIGVSSSLVESIRALEPLPLIMVEQDQVKGKRSKEARMKKTTLTYRGWSVWMNDLTQGITEKAHTRKSTRKRLGKVDRYELWKCQTKRIKR